MHKGKRREDPVVQGMASGPGCLEERWQRRPGEARQGQPGGALNARLRSCDLKTVLEAGVLRWERSWPSTCSQGPKGHPGGVFFGPQPSGRCFWGPGAKLRKAGLSLSPPRRPARTSAAPGISPGRTGRQASGMRGRLPRPSWSVGQHLLSSAGHGGTLLSPLPDATVL